MNNNEQSIENKKYPGPVAAGIFFSLTVIFLIYGAELLPFKNNYLKSGIGEVLFVLLPPLIFLWIGKYNIKDTLKLNKTRPINYLIIVFLMIFGLPVVGVLNAIALGIIRLIFGKNLPIVQLQIPDVPALLITILIAGVFAGVCEEVLFRGLIIKGYAKLGVVGSIVLSSILFGILHRDIQKAISTMLIGALCGFMVYRTKSIYAGIVAHFTNNTIAVLLTYGSGKMLERMDKMGVQQVENFDLSQIPTISLVIVAVFYGVLFLGCLFGFIGLIHAFLKTTEGNFTAPSHLTQLINSQPENENPQDGPIKEKKGLSVGAVISLLPGLILILLVFVGQILQLMNTKTGLLCTLLRNLGLN